MEQFKQCQYVFTKGAKKGSKCGIKTTNDYCKKHTKNNNKKEITIEEVKDLDGKLQEVVEKKIPLK